MTNGFVVVILASLTGCARTSVMPLAADTVQITTRAAPVCGQEGAQNIAFHRAAIETIKGGFDRFVIAGGQSDTHVDLLGFTPTTANTTSYASGNLLGNTLNMQGNSTTTVSGGVPIFHRNNQQGLVVKMFHEGEPGAENALDARAILGPNWAQAITEEAKTCF